MDPNTHYFELLKPNLESSLAKVSDIYAKFPVAATNGALKYASYKAIIDMKGNELSSDMNLSEYFQ